MVRFFSKRGIIKHEVPQGSILEPLLFIIYTNDLPPLINTLPEPLIFADNTLFIISSKSFHDFSAVSNTVLPHMSK
jgi:hypothetical protein